MAVLRSGLLVALVGMANLAAAQAAVDAGVAAQVAAGFIPEHIEPTPAVPSAAANVNGLTLLGSTAPSQDWLAVTAADCVLIQVNNRANLAAIQAAIDAEVTAQDVAVTTPSLREMKFMQLMIGGVATDVVALLFTDGAPAVS